MKFPVTIVATLVMLIGGPVHGQGWPEIFDPLVLRTLNLQMSEQDWQTIQNDETFDIEVPTLLWLDGEAPILVSIRRKSADPLTSAPGYAKVSYKIDINELVSGQNWHGLRAVSLDNGDDQDVVSEGLTWYLHRQASGPEGYGYDAGLASWVRLVINGVDTGVYVNAEQRDKRFLENRGLWVEDETWLYEVEDLNGFELDEGGPEDSPTFIELCYAPFASPSSCPTPDVATLAAEVPTLVDMQGLLALAAVDAFSANPDAIFSHGKNFYFADYLSGLPRLHFPWDLDSALGGGGIDADIYATGSAYSEILLDVPAFRAQYSQILNDLVCGPFSEAELHAFLDALEPVLADALAADPNNQLGGESVSGFFAGRKAWISQRLASVSAQIEGFVPCDVVPDPWSDLGLGLAGVSGVPQLVGMGTLIGGDPVSLSLSNANPDSSATLVIGLSLLGAPFKGGTLVPMPDALLGLFTSGTGGFLIAGTWPAGVPAGLTFWVQCWIADDAGPKGFSASNGLSGTTP
jgi:CotH kinase protein